MLECSTRKLNENNIMYSFFSTANNYPAFPEIDLEEKEPSLSTNKKIFLEQKDHRSTNLAAKNLPTLVDHYENKHNIQIIINGETSLGQSLIQKNQADIQQQIDKLKNPDIQYASFFIEHWMRDGYCNDSDYWPIGSIDSAYSQFYNKTKKQIAAFLDADRDIKKNLTPKQMLELNQICANLPYTKPDYENPSILISMKSMLDNDIKETIKHKEKLLITICLTKEQAKQEILNIQKHLEDDEPVGYIFTNKDNEHASHFEFLIITQDNIIKPVMWNTWASLSFTNEDFPNMILSTVKPFIAYNGSHQGGTPIPQGGPIECGTLGLLYLKELLKNSEKQLNQFALQVPYYNDIDALSYLFFPSPNVLRYSQSSLYNTILKTALTPIDEDIKISHKGENYTIRTLQGLLNETIAMAGTFSKARSQSIALLNQLPEYRKSWLEEFENVTKKRNLMQVDELNLYLTYKTQHLQKLADKNSKKPIGP